MVSIDPVLPLFSIKTYHYQEKIDTYLRCYTLSATFVQKSMPITSLVFDYFNFNVKKSKGL